MKSALIISSSRAFACPREILRIKDNVATLLALGWAVDLLTPRITPLMTAALPRGLRIFTVPRVPFTGALPERPSFRRRSLSFLMFLRGVTLATRRAYDVLHGIDDGACVARAIDRATVRRIPYIVELHNPATRRHASRLNPSGLFARRAERSALRHAAAIVFSDEATCLSVGVPIPMARVSFIPDPHAELFPDAFTAAEFSYALEHVYAYALR